MRHWNYHNTEVEWSNTSLSYVQKFNMWSHSPHRATGLPAMHRHYACNWQGYLGVGDWCEASRALLSKARVIYFVNLFCQYRFDLFLSFFTVWSGIRFYSLKFYLCTPSPKQTQKLAQSVRYITRWIAHRELNIALDGLKLIQCKPQAFHQCSSQQDLRETGISVKKSAHLTKLDTIAIFSSHCHIFSLKSWENYALFSVLSVH